MENKCTKYEGLMTFGDEARLLEHIAVCEDCRHEHERMQKVSELIAEVAPDIRKSRRKVAKLKMACASFALFCFVSAAGLVNFNTDIHDTIMYGQTLTLEDYGLPIDSYGLIMVN